MRGIDLIPLILNKILYLRRETSLLPPVNDQEESKSFSSGWVGIVARCVMWVGKFKAVYSSVGMRVWLIGRLVICYCPNATRDDLLSRILGTDCLFWTFVDRFIVAFGSNRLQKLSRGKLLILNCKYKVTFQPDGIAKPTCAATCFIHFGLGHRLDNIRLLKCTFVGFYLFVYLLIWLVS